MIIKFLKDTEVNGRKYLAGESREFDEATAIGLIKSGDAAFPASAELPAAEIPTPDEANPEPVKKAKKK